MRPTILCILFCFISTPWLQGQEAPRSFDLTEEMRFGSIDGPDALSRVAAIVVDSAGSVYLLQPQEHLIRQFSVDGRYQGSVGRRGSGPGEFERPTAMGWLADTLWVFDAGSGRLNLYSDGSLVDSPILNLPEPGREYSRVIPHAVLADRTVIGRMFARLVGDRFASSMDQLVHVEEAGNILSVVGTSQPMHRAMILSTGTSIMVGSSQPFADSPLWEMASDGRSLVIVERSASRSSRESRFRVTKLVLPTFDTAFTTEVRYTPRIIREELVDSIVLKIAAGISNAFPSLAVANVQVRQALYVPRFHPPVTAAVAGIDGTVWLRREDGLDGLARWEILSSLGELMGFAHSPPNLRLLAVRADTVWGVKRDAFGVESIVRYRIEE
jgi:hypothetical protein